MSQHKHVIFQCNEIQVLIENLRLKNNNENLGNVYLYKSSNKLSIELALLMETTELECRAAVARSSSFCLAMADMKLR